MRPLDGVAWFLASAMLLLTLAGCGVFGLGALVLVESLGAVDGARDQNMERVTAPVAVLSPLETATVMAPTVTAPTAVVVVEVAPTAVARSGLVLLPLVVSGVSAPAPVVIPTFTPWPTITPWPTFTLWPTFTPWPTATVTPWPTATPIYSWRATINGVEFGSDCPCDQGDSLNCDDFPGDNGPHSAQSCYLRCMALVGKDVHDLNRDEDEDDLACEYKN